MIPNAYQMDVVVENKVVVEIKATQDFHPQFLAQTRPYLKFSGHRVALIVNFHSWPLKEGIHRLVR